MDWPDWAHRQKLDWKTSLLKRGFRGHIEYVEVGPVRAIAVTGAGMSVAADDGLWAAV